MRLEQASAEDVRAFLAAYRDSPLSERLRNEWLKSLGKREQWDLFNAELPLLVGDDIEITCYALQSRLRVNRSETLPEARPLWFVGARHCRRAARRCSTRWRKRACCRATTLWTRVRLALEAGQVGLARRIARMAAARGRRPKPAVLESASSPNPAGYLAQPASTLKSRAARETVMFAVHRLARTSPPAGGRATGRSWSRSSPQEERAYVWGMIGYLGALRHDREALAWYAQRRRPLRPATGVESARGAARAQLAGSCWRRSMP